MSSPDKEIAKKIEDKAGPKDGHVSTHVMDEIIKSSGVLTDKTLASAVQNRLQEAGILPQLAIDTFSNPKVAEQFQGKDGRLSHEKLEQAAETGKVDGKDVSATSRFMADALLKHWDQIGTDGRPGVSMQELKDWGSKPENRAAGADSEMRLAVMPRDTAAVSDRSQAAGGESGREGSISLPSREDILTKPISELKDWLVRNGQKLEDAVGQNLSELQKHQFGFHGTTREGMEGINRDHEATSSKKLPDGTPSHEMYVGTPSHVAANAKEWIANMGASIEKAVDYAKDGGIALIDLGKSYARPNGDYGGVTKHGDDSQTSHPLTRNPFLPTPEKWGETDPQVNKDNFAERMKGWLDPSKWSGLRGSESNATQEAQTRHDLGQAFERQGAISEVLNKLGIKLPETGSPEGQSATDRQPPAEHISFDDFMKKASPLLKSITDCHKLWQLMTGEAEATPVQPGGPPRTRGFNPVAGVGAGAGAEQNNPAVPSEQTPASHSQVRMRGFHHDDPPKDPPKEQVPPGSHQVRMRGFHHDGPPKDPPKEQEVTPGSHQVRMRGFHHDDTPKDPPKEEVPPGAHQVRMRGFHHDDPPKDPPKEEVTPGSHHVRTRGFHPAEPEATGAHRVDAPLSNRGEVPPEARAPEKTDEQGDPRWQEGKIPDLLKKLGRPDLAEMNLEPKELNQIIYDGERAADQLRQIGESKGYSDFRGWKDLREELTKSGLMGDEFYPESQGSSYTRAYNKAMDMVHHPIGILDERNLDFSDSGPYKPGKAWDVLSPDQKYDMAERVKEEAKKESQRTGNHVLVPSWMEHVPKPEKELWID